MWIGLIDRSTQNQINRSIDQCQGSPQKTHPSDQGHPWPPDGISALLKANRSGRSTRRNGRSGCSSEQTGQREGDGPIRPACPADLGEEGAAPGPSPFEPRRCLPKRERSFLGPRHCLPERERSFLEPRRCLPERECSLFGPRPSLSRAEGGASGWAFPSGSSPWVSGSPDENHGPRALFHPVHPIHPGLSCFSRRRVRAGMNGMEGMARRPRAPGIEVRSPSAIGRA